MDTPKRIMLGYNLYFTSNKVTRVAISHTKAFGAKLFVVSSIVGHSLDKDSKVANVKAKERLDNLKRILEEESIPYEVHLLVRKNNPGDDLVNFAISHKIDEMIIGFKRRSSISEIIFGSNYRIMIAKAPCPVVTVQVPEKELIEKQ